MESVGILAKITLNTVIIICLVWNIGYNSHFPPSVTSILGNTANVSQGE